MRDTMPSQEAIQMMERCKEEIRCLRSRIAVLEPKAAAYDDMSAIIRLLPRPSQGMGEDLVWVLDKRIKELSMKPQPVEAGDTKPE